MRYYGAKKKSVKAAKKPIKKAIRQAKTANLNKAISKVISRKSETKIADYYINNDGMYIYNPVSLNFTTGAQGFFNLNPGAYSSVGSTYQIVQGTGQSDRSGNEIMPVSLYVRGMIRPNSYYDAQFNYNPCPLYVTVWVVRLRQHLNDTYNELSSVCQNTFFQYGSVARGFTGKAIDLVMPVNNDVIVLLTKKTYKLGYSNYPSAFAAGSSNNLNQGFQNNDSSSVKLFKLNLSKHLPKTMKFNDNSENVVNCRRIWCFFTVHRTDGNIPASSTGNTTDPRPAQIWLGAELKYKDI